MRDAGPPGCLLMLTPTHAKAKQPSHRPTPAGPPQPRVSHHTKTHPPAQHHHRGPSVPPHPSTEGRKTYGLKQTWEGGRKQISPRCREDQGGGSQPRPAQSPNPNHHPSEYTHNISTNFPNHPTHTGTTISYKYTPNPNYPHLGLTSKVMCKINK